MNPRSNALVEHLILQGGIEIADIDFETGETFYKINDKLKEIAPEIYKQLEDQFEHHLFIMRKKGPKTMTWRFRG